MLREQTAKSSAILPDGLSTRSGDVPAVGLAALDPRDPAVLVTFAHPEINTAFARFVNRMNINRYDVQALQHRTPGGGVGITDEQLFVEICEFYFFYINAHYLVLSYKAVCLTHLR
jgi:hypothetical protein